MTPPPFNPHPLGGIRLILPRGMVSTDSLEDILAHGAVPMPEPPTMLTPMMKLPSFEDIRKSMLLMAGATYRSPDTYVVLPSIHQMFPMTDNWPSASDRRFSY